MKIELFNQNGKRSLHSLIMKATLCVLSSMLHAVITKPSTWSAIMKQNTKSLPLLSLPVGRKEVLTEFSPYGVKSSLNSQQTLLQTFIKEAETIAKASFPISWNIVRSKHSYSDGEFVKQNVPEVITVLDTNNTRLQLLISQTPASRHTVERRVFCITLMLKTSFKII